LEDATSRRKENFRALCISEISYVLSDRPSRKVGWRPGKTLVRGQGKPSIRASEEINETIGAAFLWIKFTLEQATKAQSVSKGITVLFL